MTVLNGEDEVVELCRDLIRIDSTNAGDNAGPGERAAAEYVAEKLAEVGLEPQILESDRGGPTWSPGSRGEDPSRDALLLHGHLDVVPANADDWTAPPVQRGDRRRLRLGTRRGRHEEHGRDDARGRPAAAQRGAPPAAGRRAGVHWPTRRPAARTARSGWWTSTRTCSRGAPRRSARSAGSASPSTTTRGSTYRDGGEGHRLDAADRQGPRRARVDAQRDNAVTELAEAVGRHRAARVADAAHADGRGLPQEISEALGHRARPGRPEATVAKLGPLARMIGATLRNTANPTMLEARLQGQRDPAERDRARGRPVPARATRTSSSRPSTSCSGRT